ncbi:MAG: hypothetical protein JNM46_07030 [Anaerolineales bacterium]|nr:hypothetical protein [Anaerolineales bacterium]
MKSINIKDFYWILPSALILGAGLSSIQPGNWFIGWLSFSFLFLLSFLLLTVSAKWANGDKPLIWIVALAFLFRFSGGVATYLALPIYGYIDDEDQRAGFVYTDAHRRDSQAWELAISEQPILNAFNEKFAYDQYGGLLAFSALIYRYLSPDAHRVLMLVLISALMGTLGIPFLWKALNLKFDENIASASTWIFALYPESILLGGSAMREPYLLAFSTFVLWGFINWQNEKNKISLLWLAIGIAGMLLVSPSIALVTLIILAGWYYFDNQRGQISWWVILLVIVVFIFGMFILSSALTRGNLTGDSPLAVINNFVRESLKWNVFKIEEGSGWVQKLFDEMPAWMQLPFVMVYGFLQPVLPAIFIAPTTIVWRVIGILRSVGWYAMIPLMILSPLAGAGLGQEKKRKVILWLSIIAWAWILFTALRGGGDQWDNPRYRTILFMWQAILAGYVWVWWRETKNAWLWRVVLMELVLIFIFGNWYANRYWYIGLKLPFAQMVGLILGAWALIFVWGIWRDRIQHRV